MHLKLFCNSNLMMNFVILNKFLILNEFQTMGCISPWRHSSDNSWIIPYCGKVWQWECLVNLTDHQPFTTLKPSQISNYNLTNFDWYFYSPNFFSPKFSSIHFHQTRPSPNFLTTWYINLHIQKHMHRTTLHNEDHLLVANILPPTFNRTQLLL